MPDLELLEPSLDFPSSLPQVQHTVRQDHPRYQFIANIEESALERLQWKYQGGA